MDRKVLSEDQINVNYLRYTDALKKYNCYSEEMFGELGEKIKNAPFTMENKFGGAYDGGMIDIVLNHICPLAYKINKQIFPTSKGLESLCLNEEMLMRVLLLQHISKALFFVSETNDWRLKNGVFYTFNDDNHTKLRLGEKTIFLCNKYGIRLSEEEHEAILILDKKEIDGFVFCSQLAILSLSVNMMISKALLATK